MSCYQMDDQKYNKFLVISMCHLSVTYLLLGIGDNYLFLYLFLR